MNGDTGMDRIALGETGMDETDFETEVRRLRGLLDPAGVEWALAAGSAVYLYARNRQPADLDVLIRPDDLPSAGAAMKAPPVIVTTAWGESERIEVGRVEVAGRLVVRMEGHSYPYVMDAEMVDRRRWLECGGVTIPVLAPEDVIAFKAVLRRGQEQGKHDLADIDALASAAELDLRYLRQRLNSMGALERAMPVLAVRGWAN